MEWSGDLGDLFSGAGADVFSDFFRSIFGGMGGTQRTGRPEDLFGRVRRGQDLEAPAEITLEEAFHGTTRMLERDGRRIRVKIPPGARDGSRIRVAGKGSSSPRGGTPGDLYLNITVKPHAVFKRENDNLHCDVNIGLYTAVLGGQAQITTLNGDVSLRIPAGTSGGKTFRLRGKGMPNPRNPKKRGDLFATIRIRVPQDLSPPERELFEELSRLQERK